MDDLDRATSSAAVPIEGEFLAGGGELGAHMRSLDWSRHPLGPVEGWPQSLKTAVSILLNSRYPMFIFWGPSLIKIYNDGYRPILGAKHPWALGRPGPEVWPEIWDTIGPLVQRATAGEATWSDDLLLFMERNGYPEEVYFTFSYSPVRDESGRVGGMLCACTETTAEVLSRRRLETLRALAAVASDTRTVQSACTRSVEILVRNEADVPFALLYMFDGRQGAPRLAAAGGGTASDGAEVSKMRLLEDPAAWPLERTAETGAPVRVEDLARRWPAVPPGPWPEPPSEAFVVPIEDRAVERTLGALVLGISSRRAFDRDYRTFFALVSGQFSSSIANARASEEERRRAEALAELDRAKTRFFSNVSHEFRTPLTLMLGPLEQALGSEERVLRGESLESVHRSALRLLRLVNTLLDFSRIEANRMDACFEPTDLAGLTADLSSSFRSLVETAGLQLRVECEPIGEPVFVDPGMWEKVVLNLLSNAFKFTFEGYIAVQVRRTAGNAELTVTDTGVGIPAQELPHVFERFRRVQGVRSRTHEGTGIGLALVHELVGRHGGTIGVSSEEGRGSAFTVRIPLGTEHLPQDKLGRSQGSPSPRAEAAAFVQEAAQWREGADVLDADGAPSNHGGDAQEASAGAEGERTHTVLVVDDNADMRSYLRKTLEPHFRVVLAGDGEQALERIRRARPDLVIADVMMPVLDGFGLLRAIRDDPETADLPLIMVSARAGPEASAAGVDAGADDYLVKPFSAPELLARVRLHLRLMKARRHLDELLEQARITERRKDEFLAMLGHELRNPLAPLQLTLDLLRQQETRTLTERQFDAVARQTATLTRLVEDLLDVSRVQRGRMELRRESVDLVTILRHSLDTAAGLIGERNHELTVHLPAEPSWVEGDAVRLEQVFTNILVNAAKYTPPGGRIRVEGRRDQDDVCVHISDSGIGIAPEHLKEIFELFGQVSGSKRGSNGLGLGLSIVKKLVEMHGGAVSASSAGPGQGSEFVVRLPLDGRAEAHGHRPAATDASAGPSPGALEALRILIVDDNADAASALADLLRAWGHHTRVATDGAAALDALGPPRSVPSRYDLALLDIDLPDIDGYELAGRIRSCFGPRPRLVAVTGLGQPDDRERSRHAGFAQHLTKPVTRDQLRTVMEASAPRRASS